MNHRRVAVAALAAAGLLAVGACGDPDSQEPAQAQQAPAAHQRMVEAHRNFQQAFEDAAAKKVVVYAPASPDAIEHNAVEAAKPLVHYRPFSPDAIEHNAVEAADAAPWWAHKR